MGGTESITSSLLLKERFQGSHPPDQLDLIFIPHVIVQETRKLVIYTSLFQIFVQRVPQLFIQFTDTERERGREGEIVSAMIFEREMSS